MVWKLVFSNRCNVSSIIFRDNSNYVITVSFLHNSSITVENVYLSNSLYLKLKNFLISSVGFEFNFEGFCLPVFYMQYGQGLYVSDRPLTLSDIT